MITGSLFLSVSIVCACASSLPPFFLSASFRYCVILYRCTACPSGKFSRGKMDACEDCPVGTSSPFSAPNCSECSVGTFAPLPGTGSPCTNCAAGQFATATVSSLAHIDTLSIATMSVPILSSQSSLSFVRTYVTASQSIYTTASLPIYLSPELGVVLILSQWLASTRDGADCLVILGSILRTLRTQTCLKNKL